ncbi:MAG: site-specific DNA-methyltransferase [Flavobacteriaceae bacterium]|nr:site-specific DNA-methyltransferase [Flavobacteriaceae bacterium]
MFLNETLASDEIDRLFEPKVLTNWKRYDQDGEHKVSQLSKNEDGTLNENLIIKGNNLIALHSIKNIYRGKVKLIYIDPPYNTGNDGFGYNDSFNHSTWLSFMKNRLEVAREFLTNDGLLVVHIDDHEQAYLKVLLDKIMGRENFVGDLIRKTKSTTNDAKTGFNIQHENTLIYAKNKSEILIVGKKKSFDKYKNPDNDPNGAWVIADPSARSGDYYFPITNPYTRKVDYPPENRQWLFSESRLQDYIASGKVKFRRKDKQNQRGFIFKRYKSEIKSEYHLIGSLETATNSYMNQVATKEKNKLFGQIDFDYPKPEAFAQLIIEGITNPSDIVMDFFLGSGTTSAVAHKIGRRYIGIEQMDYIETIVLQRLQKVIKGEKGGVSVDVSWQGGGNFIYFELAKNTQSIAEEIDNSDDSSALMIWEKLKEHPHIHYRVQFQKNTDDQFKNLSLLDKKKVLKDLLDKNMLYIPYSEIDNKDFQINSKDADLSNQFYSI